MTPTLFPLLLFYLLFPLYTSDTPFSLLISFSFLTFSILYGSSTIRPSFFISLFLSNRPPLTPGHLLRDRLPCMCDGGPAVRHPDAHSWPLLLHVPLLWQLRWRDAPTAEEERRLSAWPAGNAALLHLTGHHVSMTHAHMTHTGKNTQISAIASCDSVCTHVLYMHAHVLGLYSIYTSAFYSARCKHVHRFRQKHTVHTRPPGHHVSAFHTHTHTPVISPPHPPYCLLYIVKSYCRYYVAAHFILMFGLRIGCSLQGIHTESFHLLWW